MEISEELSAKVGRGRNLSDSVSISDNVHVKVVHTILIKDPDKITLAIEIWITYSKTKWSTNILKSNLNNTRSTIRDLGCA